jgi:type I restriction enzyme R subunit
VKEPRYYQRVAINRAVAAIVGGDKRLLLTLATGAGKTFVSLQIVWKLWSGAWIEDRKPRVLYLADRTILVDQPMSSEYLPAFGEGPIWKLQGEAKAGREIYFGLYQALADGGDVEGLYRQFAPDFFDLVIVDECHRGSANAGSSWRAILEYFSAAAQLGMTATPKREDTVDTYDWFGEPIYEYSLAQGIDDGFLAPYRARRVVLSPDAHGWAPTQGQLDRFGHMIPDDLYTTKDFERVVSLLSRTEAAAVHLTDYLKRTNRMAKTVVFCVDQEHADQMRRALHNVNSDTTSQYPDYVVRIVSDEGNIGRGHLSAFSDVEMPTPVIATTSQLLSTGVDIPTLRNVVLFRPIGSMALFKQIIGRGTRLYPDDDKLTFDIVDYAGATVPFEDPEFDVRQSRSITRRSMTRATWWTTRSSPSPSRSMTPRQRTRIRSPPTMSSLAAAQPGVRRGRIGRLAGDAFPGVVGDDDVVKEAQAHYLGGGSDVDCCLSVSGAGCRVATRVVVGDREGPTIVAEYGVENLSRWYE